MCILNELSEFAEFGGWFNANRWKLDHVRAKRTKLACEHARLFARARDHNSFSGKRPLLGPFQIFSYIDNLTKNRYGRRFETGFGGALRDLFQSASKRF